MTQEKTSKNNNLPSHTKGWRKVKLSEVIKFGNGKVRPRSKGNIPVYGGNGILGYTSHFNYQGETIIIGRVGAYCGSVYFEDKPIWISDNALSVKTMGSNDARYFFYLLKNLNLNQIAEGSSHPLVTQVLLNSLYVSICESANEQKAIAEVLSSLDDKIDLLHRQNKTLEDIVQTLFRKWFIEEAKDDWEVGKLGDVISSIESGSRPKGGINPELKIGIPSIGAENINGIGNYNFSKTKYISEDFFNSMKKGIIQSYDLLIYKDGAYIGRKGMFGNNFPYSRCSVNEHVFVIRGNERVNQFFLYFLLSQEELSQLNANSAQPGLNQEAVKSFEIIIPPKELIDKFGYTVKVLVDKILLNANQIRTLEKLRDILLPKLISGKIRIK